MAILVVSIVLILELLDPLRSLALTESEFPIDNEIPKDFNHSYFPRDFLWGSSSSSYQYEGAANKDSRGPSIWDTMTHDHPDRIKDHKNGDVAIDFYHRYKEDVKRMKKLNMNAFRFSISWSRVVPSGKVSEGINWKGVKFYKKLINELIKNDMVPYVTLFHWDTPQVLEDKYGGFLSSKIVGDFQDYAEFCFKVFGGKVQNWVTFNEPETYSIWSYDTGVLAPARCSSWINKNCIKGNSATEPYIVAYNILNAHAAAVNTYRSKYQAVQNGKIGIVLNCDWFEPYSNNKEDKRASIRAMDFQLGWFLQPITSGAYPSSMRARVKNRLPHFTKNQSSLLKGSYDFVGLNYYSADYARNIKNGNPERVRALTDIGVESLDNRDGKLIGPYAASAWLKIVPWGITKLLEHIKYTYNNPEIYVTENGMDVYDNGTMTLKELLHDTTRKEYIRHHIWNIYKAIKDSDVNVKGYLLWSALDNFEWINGYAHRFGIIHVDYNNNLKRYNKDSAKWYKKFLS